MFGVECEAGEMCERSHSTSPVVWWLSPSSHCSGAITIIIYSCKSFLSGRSFSSQFFLEPPFLKFYCASSPSVASVSCCQASGHYAPLLSLEESDVYFFPPSFGSFFGTLYGIRDC